MNAYILRWNPAISGLRPRKSKRVVEWKEEWKKMSEENWWPSKDVYDPKITKE